MNSNKKHCLRNQNDKTPANLKTVEGKVSKTRKNVQLGIGTFGMRSNWLSIGKKLEIIENYENGANFAKLTCDFGMHELTIRAIVRRKEEIKESVRKNIENETYINNINKLKLADEMEKLLISKNESK